jgi:hypothetical protein
MGYDPVEILYGVLSGDYASARGAFGYHPINAEWANLVGANAQVVGDSAGTTLRLNRSSFDGPNFNWSRDLAAFGGYEISGRVGAAATPYVYMAMTLIHELGHVFNRVPALGGSLIVSNDSPANINRYNRHLVYNSCVAPYFGLREFDNPFPWPPDPPF